jgi:hypothetical protein
MWQNFVLITLQKLNLLIWSSRGVQLRGWDVGDFILITLRWDQTMISSRYRCTKGAPVSPLPSITMLAGLPCPFSMHALPSPACDACIRIPPLLFLAWSCLMHCTVAPLTWMHCHLWLANPCGSSNSCWQPRHLNGSIGEQMWVI